MANEFDLQSQLPEDLQLAQQQLNRQQALAQALMAQNQQPQGQMISGQYVAPAWTQQLAPLVNQLTGAYIGKKGDEKATQLAQQLRQGKQSEQAAIMEALNKGDNKTALALATGSQYGAGKQFTPALIKANIPEQTTSMREFTEAQRSPQFANFLNQQNQAKGTNINVNTGQHGFDNALKLRSDFRAEPIYKGFEEVKSAKNQIDQAAKMASPAGDLAAATKVMKILDPGSVVRESELGMAMQATGLEDKVGNYAKMVIDGTKLTPSQRKDFTELSNKLYNASAEQFNQKRNEYAGIAQRNKLDVEAAVGAPADIKKPKLRWNPQTGSFE